MIFSSPVIERDRLGADALDELVVDLAREQPQRQADDAGRMREHALDGEMRLAGIGRPEHGGHARAARTRVAEAFEENEMGIKCPKTVSTIR